MNFQLLSAEVLLLSASNVFTAKGVFWIHVLLSGNVFTPTTNKLMFPIVLNANSLWRGRILVGSVGFVCVYKIRLIHPYDGLVHTTHTCPLHVIVNVDIWHSLEFRHVCAWAWPCGFGCFLSTKLDLTWTQVHLLGGGLLWFLIDFRRVLLGNVHNWAL